MGSKPKDYKDKAVKGYNPGDYEDWECPSLSLERRVVVRTGIRGHKRLSQIMEFPNHLLPLTNIPLVPKRKQVMGNYGPVGVNMLILNTIREFEIRKIRDSVSLQTGEKLFTRLTKLPFPTLMLTRMIVSGEMTE